MNAQDTQSVSVWTTLPKAVQAYRKRQGSLDTLFERLLAKPEFQGLSAKTIGPEISRIEKGERTKERGHC